MVRAKIRYELIADERTRRETYKKRKSGLFKKLHELKTLCDVEVCGIVINGDGAQSDVWPSPQEAYRVVEKFRTLSSSQANNTVDQTGFLRQNLSRLSKNLDKETKKVESLEEELFLADCVAKEEVNQSNSNALRDMFRLLEKKIRMVDKRIANIEFSSSSRVASAKEHNNYLYHGKGKQPL